MNRIIKSTLALAVFALAVPMFAATKDSTINVTANVVGNCTISTTTHLDFGDYDPVVVNASVAKNEEAPAAISISCTKGSTPALSFTTTGTMTGGGDTLAFNLFSNSGRTIALAGSTMDFSAGKAAQTVNIWGELPAGQDVAVGPYTGTITATITY
jgi:spore coat protein U-like protein